MADTTAYGPTPSVGLDDFQALINQDYHTMPYTNSSATDIAAGAPVVVNGLVGIAIGVIAAGKSGTLLILTTVNVVRARPSTGIPMATPMAAPRVLAQLPPPELETIGLGAALSPLVRPRPACVCCSSRTPS
jgi:hypothetical protein